MEIVKFKKSGGPLYVEVIGGEAQPGSYSLFLWEADGNKIAFEVHGNFLSPDDDTHKLPLPNEANNGRTIDVGITFVITPPIKNYYAELKITQDDKIIGKVFTEGTTDKTTITILLKAKLSMEDE